MASGAPGINVMNVAPRFSTLLALLLLCVPGGAQDRTVVPPGTTRAGTRHALVIGNKDYPRQPLTNPVNDATDLAAALKAAGFAVALETNLNRDGMYKALDTFTGKLTPGDAALVYFSGHGLEVQGQNYLLPVDFDAAAEYQVRGRALNAGEILEALRPRGVAVSILILDACRNNPYRSWARSRSGGLAALQADQADGAFIAFAAAPGQVASDNPTGRNGLFTKHLKEAIQQPGLSIDEVFSRVREQVFRESGTGQRPYVTTGLIGRFAFQGVDNRPPGDPALEAWNDVKDSGSVGLLEEFRKQFPDSMYARLASVRLAAIRERPQAPPEAPQPEEPSRGKRVNPKDGLTYVYIAPGAFLMGCSPGDNECQNDEKPAKQVTISRGFYLSESEVTQGAYQRVTGENPSHFKGPDLPVETVTWNEASGYCQQIGGRLPTAAEWEYAARAGSTGARYGDLDRVAWYDGNSGRKPHAVKQKEPNAWGLYDMLGNVWEWTADQWQDGRELRGGSCYNLTRLARASYRSRFEPSNRNVDFGLRCAWE
jgi:formylglycine-generating enzyme required for sulfatase activity